MEKADKARLSQSTLQTFGALFGILASSYSVHTEYISTAMEARFVSTYLQTQDGVL